MFFDEMSRNQSTEKSLDLRFGCCECVVDDLLKGRLGDSHSAKRNGTLMDCIHSLQSIAKSVEELSLFSANDSVEELPTSSLRFLLVPSYLATLLQEIGVEMDKRGSYLRAAKAHYREFLQNMSIFGLINFRLPWSDEDERKSEDQQKEKENSRSRSGMISSFEDANARRQRTISRLQQLKQLEETVEQLKNEKRRNDDEVAQRELIFALLRLWSVRSVKELEMIEEELKMVEQFEAQKSQSSSHGDYASTSRDVKFAEPLRLKPFILARSEAQKRVFGLGYPSVPTKTVDEWYDEMQKNGTFGRGTMPTSFTINQHKTNEEAEEEEEEESKRQAQIRRDEWKDMNRRGCGNTYNKG